MICKVFASGSKGNITLIEHDDTFIIIDMGISCRRVENFLAERGVSPHQINGILITHEHRDHISGLKIFLKKYKVPVYTTEKTLDAINKHFTYDVDIKFLDKNKSNSIGNLEVTPFELSHDAVDPLGFVITDNNKKYVHITDTGYLNTKHYDLIKEADVYFFESNHDIMMLRNGSYPWPLQQRILSDYGHLSNIDASYHLLNIIGDNTHTIILAHLSEENNSKEVTLETHLPHFEDSNINVILADQYVPLDDINI